MYLNKKRYCYKRKKWAKVLDIRDSNLCLLFKAYSESSMKNLANTLLRAACKFLFSLSLSDATGGACLTLFEKLFHACIAKGKQGIKKDIGVISSVVFF